MMLKYEFPNRETAIEIAGEGNGIVHLGHIVLEPAVIERNGAEIKVIKPATLSSKWHVDILHDSEPKKELKQYEVWPEPIGIHTFAGWEKWYENEYNKRFGK